MKKFLRLSDTLFVRIDSIDYIKFGRVEVRGKEPAEYAVIFFAAQNSSSDGTGAHAHLRINQQASVAVLREFIEAECEG